MKALKPILKIIVSILILFFVYKKIDAPELWATLKTVNPLWIVLAFLLFVLSQYVSSIRLQYFWKDINVKLSNAHNWKLYLIGMYYNLLLPGGIGGDGYKVVVIDKAQQVGKGKLIKALVFDRLSGLLGLGIWLCVRVNHQLFFNEKGLYEPFSKLLAQPGLIACNTGSAIGHLLVDIMCFYGI